MPCRIAASSSRCHTWRHAMSARRPWSTEHSAGERLSMRISWTKVESETEPPTRLGSVLLAEAGTGGALLVGGGTNEYSCLDTWRFDGQRWTQVCPQGTGPDVMDGVAAAVGDKVVMFGSSHRHYGFPTLARGTTWTWDGTQWHEDPARRGPRTRYHASMAYYPPEDSAVLFGGGSGSMPMAVGFEDTWTWCRGEWRELHLRESPPARLGGILYWDADFCWVARAHSGGGPSMTCGCSKAANGDAWVPTS